MQPNPPIIQRYKTRQKLLSVISFLAGAFSVFTFLTLNDPDKVSFATINKFGWLILSPTALIFALWPRSTFGMSTLSMISGIFVGACVRCLISSPSNIWPLAAAIWTATFLLPVVVGAAVGGLGSWCLRKKLE